MMIRLAALLTFLTLAALPGMALAGPHSGYSVSRTSDGIQLTVRFERHAYPAHALIAVTATLRNLSHQHLAVERTFRTFGLCSWPAISMVSVNAQGQDVEPVPPIPHPVPSCPFPGAIDLPIGHSVVEHQLIVLWSSRLRVTAQLFNYVHNCYCGFSFQGPIVRFHLHRAPAPTISVQSAGGLTVAVISPQTAVRDPLYYESWGDCAAGQTLSAAYYWSPLADRVVSSGCAHPNRWHLDVAWLNAPVASLDLGAPHTPYPVTPIP